MANNAVAVIELKSIEHMMNLFGSFDENIRIIEDALGVRVVIRNGEIKISGEQKAVARSRVVIDSLMDIMKQGCAITGQTVRNMVESSVDNSTEAGSCPRGFYCMTSKGRIIKPRTLGQRNYINAMKNKPMVFGIGPAGTGKTFLAVAMAVSMLRNNEVNRIVLTRPAVEAGEKLGFLPGDLQNKVDPYLRPVYDALFEIMGADTFQKSLEKGVIEVAPLAYMRGRTLDDSFVILDEAQNTTSEQMKMFLTRLGCGSRAVINGDITQIDLPSEKVSGLKEAIKILEEVEDIEFVYLTEKDVVRHKLVQRIIKAYEDSKR